jgi:hypothetical protein
MKLMHGLKMVFLLVGLISSFSFGSIARAGERWPEREAPGKCPVNQVCDQYPIRFKPPDAWGIGGFYINLTTERSFVTIQWTATKCNNEQITGTKDISTGSTGGNYIDFPNKAPWEPGVCSFKYILLNARSETGADTVYFVMNYDLDY